MVTEEVTMKRGSLAGQALVAALALMVVAVCCHKLCGTFAEKRGLFFHGIQTEEDYRKIIRLYHGRTPKQIVPIAQDHVVDLSPDGHSTLDWSIRYACMGDRGEVRLENMWNIRKCRVASTSGTPLEFTLDGDNPATLDIRLPNARTAIEQFVLEGSLQDPPLVTLQNRGQQAEYEFRHTYGPPLRYTHVLNVPPGTKLINCDPDPEFVQYAKDGVHIRFREELGDGKTFRCHVVLEFAE